VHIARYAQVGVANHICIKCIVCQRSPFKKKCLLQKSRAALPSSGGSEVPSERLLEMRKKANQQRTELKRLKVRGASQLKNADEERPVVIMDSALLSNSTNGAVESG